MRNPNSSSAMIMGTGKTGMAPFYLLKRDIGDLDPV
jgi:hypothetical protein